MAGPIDNDVRIMELAAPRGGVCTRAELVAHGVAPGAIDQRVRRGFLEPVCRGVYLITALVNAWTPMYRAVAALPSAIISHLTAGRFRGFPVEPPLGWEPVHVLVENGTNRRLDGVVLHRVRRLPEAFDMQVVNGLPITGPARTIVDLASAVGPDRLRHEADGRRWHSREQEMAGDRRRDRLAVRHGWVTLRFTWAEITGRPSAVASELRAVLATRAATATAV